MRKPASRTGLLLLAAACCSGVSAVAQPAPGAGVATVPHVADNATLAATRTAAYRGGLWRDHYAAGGIADGPLFFTPRAGTCAANKWVNDGGNCVDGPDGNSWKAIHPDGAMNVKEFGATGANGPDDYPAFQAAIVAAQSAMAAGRVTYAKVIVPSGQYCIKSADPKYGIHITANTFRLEGGGNVGLMACGVDTTVLTLDGPYEYATGLGILGYNAPGATHAAVQTTTKCVQCVLDHITAIWGKYAFDINGADGTVRWSKANDAYGSALVHTNNGNMWVRNTFDQTYPAGGLPAASYTLKAWASSHRYASKDMVTIAAGAWVLQQTGGSCTSGSGSEPAVAIYGTNITDGSCRWQLLAPGTYYGMQYESGSTVSYADMTDTTGPFSYCVGLTNDLGGIGPTQTTLRGGNFGQCLHGGLYVRNGAGLSIEQGQATNCVLAGCKGVDIRSTWSDKVNIGDGFIAYQNPYGVYVGGGVGFVMNGASVHGSTTACVDIAAGVTKFIINSNDFSTGPTWGSCKVAVRVEAGASDYYSITNNLVQGSTIGISDAGTGKHKTVMGNN